MKVLYIFSFLIFLTFYSNAQINPGLLVNIHSVPDTVTMNQIVGAEEGSLIYNIGDKSLYLWEGSAWKATYKYSVVENEIFLEDDDYFYVSLKIRMNEYKVVRYDRNDVNAEAVSKGTGTQPTDLISVQSLTYN